MMLGIRRVDAKIYFYLATNGPKKVRDLARDLDIYKQKLYRSLKNLKEKGLVKATEDSDCEITIQGRKVYDSLRNVLFSIL